MLWKHRTIIFQKNFKHRRAFRHIYSGGVKSVERCCRYQAQHIFNSLTKSDCAAGLIGKSAKPGRIEPEVIVDGQTHQPPPVSDSDFRQSSRRPSPRLRRRRIRRVRASLRCHVQSEAGPRLQELRLRVEACAYSAFRYHKTVPMAQRKPEDRLASHTRCRSERRITESPPRYRYRVSLRQWRPRQGARVCEGRATVA
jgi:hypothetical protein